MARCCNAAPVVDFATNVKRPREGGLSLLGPADAERACADFVKSPGFGRMITNPPRRLEDDRRHFLPGTPATTPRKRGADRLPKPDRLARLAANGPAEDVQNGGPLFQLARKVRAIRLRQVEVVMKRPFPLFHKRPACPCRGQVAADAVPGLCDSTTFRRSSLARTVAASG